MIDCSGMISCTFGTTAAYSGIETIFRLKPGPSKE
jgi:hypothetical protein